MVFPKSDTSLEGRKKKKNRVLFFRLILSDIEDQNSSLTNKMAIYKSWRTVVKAVR